MSTRGGGATTDGGHTQWWARSVRLPTWLLVFLWGITAGLLVVILMRLVAWDELEVFAVANTVTAFIYLPAWFIAPLALIGQQRALATAAILVVIAQLFFLAPELRAKEPLPSWAPHATAFTLFDANVYNDNVSVTGYERQIEHLRPALVTLEEATPPKVASLERSGALSHLPYRYSVRRSDPFAFLIASAFPLSAIRVISLFGRPLIVESQVHLPGRTIELWVVHTIAPLAVSFEQWRDQLHTIARMAAQHGSRGLLVVGDFNATWGNQGFRQILGQGLTDGAAARGVPFEMTWSQIMRPLPPFVRIDHVLTGMGVAVKAIQTGPGIGSDHRELRAQILVETRPERSPAA